MRIEIKDDIFNSNDFTNLTHLIRIVFQRPSKSINTKAKVFIDLDKCTNTVLYNRLDSIDRELLEASTKEYFYESSPCINYIVSNNNSKESYNLEEAIELLKEPFWILLENSKNDQEFIKSIIFHFEVDNEYLKECLKNRWIQFDNAGGCGNVKNLLTHRINSFENLAVSQGSLPRKYYRGMVILDSDREFSTQSTKQDYEKLIEYFTKYNIPFHILEKRAMENYMPDEVLFDIQREKSNSKNPDDKKFVRWVNVYRHLSNIQKDFLKYDGLDSFEKLKPEVKNLYQNQVPSNFSLLVSGISYRDHNALEDDEKRFKNAFPKLFTQSPLVNKASLKARSGTDELERIFNKINQLL